MAKPETVPTPIQGLAHALEVASEHGGAHLRAAQDAFNARFADGFPPAHDHAQDAPLPNLVELPETLDSVLDRFLGDAVNAPGMDHARAHFPHLDDFPSLPTETLFSTPVV